MIDVFKIEVFLPNSKGPSELEDLIYYADKNSQLPELLIYNCEGLNIISTTQVD